MIRIISTIIFSMICSNIFAQIEIIEFDGTDDVVFSTIISNPCDGTPGVFGPENGAFVISDMEGLPCCGCAFGGALLECGPNNNLFTINGIDPLLGFCDVTIQADVRVRGNGSTLECANNSGSNTTEVGCNPAGDPGRDAMAIHILVDGRRMELGSYCGNQRNGTFSLSGITGTLVSIEITGGTQDPDEAYEIERIVISGTQAPSVPYDILNPTANQDLCENMDVLVLNAVGPVPTASTTYEWFLDGTLLPTETMGVLTRAPVALADAGRYSVIISEPSSPCPSSEVFENVQVINCAAPVAGFSANFKDRFCRDTDVLNLPTVDNDQGVAGTWNVPNNLVLNTVPPFTELIFTPDPSSGVTGVTIPIQLDQVPQFGTFLTAGTDFCEYNDPGLTVDLVSVFNLNVNDIDVISYQGMTMFSESEWRNAPVPNTNGPAPVEVTTIPFGLCGPQFQETMLNVKRIDRLTDPPIVERCEMNIGILNLTTLLANSGDPDGQWTDLDGSGLDITTDPRAVDASLLGVGQYRFEYSISCASISESAILTLDVQSAPSATINPPDLCQGDGYSVTYNGRTYDQSMPFGIEAASDPSGVCDSIITIDLQFAPVPERTLMPTGLCIGQDFTFNGVTYTQSQLTEVTVPNPGGCDSIITLDLQFSAQPSATRTIADLCVGTPYVFNGFSYTRDTIADVSVPGLPGDCDSLLTLNIQFRPQPTDSRTISDLCLGTPFDLDGVSYTRDTMVEVTAPGVSGDCDSLITYELIFQTGPTRPINEVLCEGDIFPYNGVTYTQDTNEEVVVFNPNGCDSIVTLQLTFTTPNTATKSPSNLCELDTFRYAGNIYTIANPTDVVEVDDPTGPCDSVITIDLNFLTIGERNITSERCENDGFSVTFNGNTYDETNTTGTEMIPSPNGCDSIINIDLFFKPNVMGAENNIGRSGDGYSVVVGGVTYDENNPTGTEVFPAANGCDSIIVVDLVFIEGVFDSLVMTACTGEGFSIPGQNGDYNEANPSGIDTFTTTDGRDSFFITRLTFLDPVINRYTATLTSGIGFDTTFNGMTYDETNPIGRDTISNGAANSCDSIILVNLEFVDAFINEFDTTLCLGDTYSRSVGFSNYDESNPSGIDTFMTSAGIDSFVSTTLNFVGPSTFTFTASRCLGDGFTYPPGTNSFNENRPSGDTTIVGGAANGCDSIITVMLTFRDQIITDNTQTICRDNEVMVGTSTYGLATTLIGIDTLPTASGCDSVVMTNLTIDSISIDYCVKDVCPDVTTTTLSIFNLQPTLPLIANINGQDYNIADSVEITIDLNDVNQLIISNQRGCSIAPEVIINNAAMFTLDIMDLDIPGDSVMLDFNFDGIVADAAWSAASGTVCSDCLSINVDGTTANTYTISVVDELGCDYEASFMIGDSMIVDTMTVDTMMIDTMMVDTMTVDTIIVDTMTVGPPISTTVSNFYVGNVFSRNSLDNINTRFFLQTVEPDIISYDMTIYNRWGNLVFDRVNLAPNDSASGWDGNGQNNQDVQSGVYFYKVVLNKDDGSIEIGGGDILFIN